MPTKKVTANQYAPAGMAAYNSLIPQAASNLQQFMQNPLQSSFFNQNQQLSNNNINTMQQGNMTTLLNNMKSLGVGGYGASPFLASQLAQMGRAGSAMKANSFMSNLLGMNQMRLGATQQSAAFQPLQTGSTQQTSGVGTWLPQVAGMALGALTGGASTLLSSPFASSGGFAGTPTAGSMGSNPFLMQQSSPISGALTPPSV